MNQETEGNLFGLLLLILNVGSWLLTGYWAWQVTEPEGFFDLIGFAIVWAFFGWIATYAIAIVLGILFNVGK